MKNNYITYIAATLFFYLPAHAQNYIVGNPGSENTLFLKNTVEYINDQQPETPTDWEPLPDSPGVEVAPPPNRTPKDTFQANEQPEKVIFENTSTIIEPLPQMSSQQFD